MRFLALLLLAAAGCVTSESAGFVDDDPAHPPVYFEKSPRVWAKDREITVELEETRGPVKIVRIDYRVDDGNVYLWPSGISGRTTGTTRLVVDLHVESLPEDWKERVYWLTGESYYPPGHSAFWDRSLREPAHRTKVDFVPAPD